MADSNLGQHKANLLGSWQPVDYVEQRVKQYQSWYDKKAVKAKKKYLYMRTTIVMGGVVIPVILNVPIPWKDAVASIVSLIVASCVALESIYHFREQWKNYRSTEQFLGRELVLFLSGEGSYKNVESSSVAFIQFVERCEGAIEAENASTLNIMTLAPQQGRSHEASDNSADV